MLTVTLTPHDLPTHKDRAKSMGVMTGASALDMECPTRAGRALGGVAWVGPQKNGGWGTPALRGAISPPTPFSTPRVRNFLKMLRDEEYLKSIGIVMTSSRVKRIFSQDVIMDSLKENNGLDIDDTLLTTKPVGAHIISDMELIRLTDDERDEVFREEGLGNKFDFNLNCRASSARHNQRMGVLRLSEYLPIIDNNEKVKEVRLEKYHQLKAKPILI